MDQATATKKFQERVQRVEDAIALKESDKIPFAPFFASAVQRLYGSSYRDIFYDHQRAGEAAVKFYTDYPCDGHYFSGFTSGRANELAGSTMIDWPGRPGGMVAHTSSHQVIELEYLLPEEYPELIDDYSGFMIKKYIPRAYGNLKAFSRVALTPTIVLSTSFLAPLYDPEMIQAYETLAQIGKLDAETRAVSVKYIEKLAAIGIPPMVCAASEAPYDILGDYFRGTVGIMEDLFEYEEEVATVCDMFADQQIASLQRLKDAPFPVKRVFFPLHKGMDGFMNPSQYAKLYWRPLKKILLSLIDIGVTPLVYTEGKYDSRLEMLTDIPAGKVIYHFEDVDMQKAKKVLQGTACISGNLPAMLMEFGKKEQVIDYCKYLIDTCAAGGGYIFDTNACMENATRENLDAMFEVFETYR
ncbi:MAG: uroporphyrinogen decarboxylase family protein [Desulfopila sp.]